MVDILWLESQSDGYYQYCCDYSVEQCMSTVCYEGEAVREKASSKFKHKNRDNGYK
jgi:hypothetical protein